MKIRSAFAALVLISALILASCAGTSGLPDNAPYWITNPGRQAGRMVFVGEGHGSGEYTARIAAYEDILDSVSSTIGEVVNERYRLELTNSGSVSVLDLRTDATYSYRPNTGGVSYYVLVSVNEEIIRTMMSSTAIEIENAEVYVREKFAEASAALRESRDFDALSSLTDAAIRVHGYMMPEASENFEEIMARIESIARSIVLRIDQINPAEVSCRVRMNRDRGIFDPAVYMGKAVVRYSALDPLGRDYTDDVVFTTDSRGEVYTAPQNYSLYGSGKVTVAPAFYTYADRIESVAGSDAVAGLRAAEAEKTLSFEYDRYSPASAAGIAVSILEYDEVGTQREGGIADAQFVAGSAVFGVTVRAVELRAADDEMENLPSLQRALVYPESRYGVVAAAGVTEVTQIGESEWAVLIQGGADVYDYSDNSAVFETEEYSAAGIGSSIEEATDAAFMDFGRQTCNLCQRVFFR